MSEKNPFTTENELNMPEFSKLLDDCIRVLEDTRLFNTVPESILQASMEKIQFVLAFMNKKTMKDEQRLGIDARIIKYRHLTELRGLPGRRG